MATNIRQESLEIISDDQVYEPREDSYLIIDNIESFSRDRIQTVLEIGCGSGVISLSYLHKFPQKHYIAVDISYEAVCLTLRNMKKNNLDNLLLICSDLTSAFRKGIKFDEIIFNPPYLPEDEFDEYLSINDLNALVGGKIGIEKTIRFIEYVKSYTTKIITIISSLSVALDEFAKLVPKWEIKIIDDKKLGFETIWLVLLTRKLF
ncbi:MAG: Release factor glutamine methyltransferase [Candidatus Heimdallarchaeota archaeon LC_2]|nr:MAG: Release factor glutamine methyltransferase [Candidatus Heimdallarchaeota archaeon LC_2]